MKKKLTILAIVVVIAGLALVAYTLKKDDTNDMDAKHQEQSSTSEAQPVADAQSGTVAASISDFKYSPQSLKVKKGTVVTWTNNDEVRHDVTSDSDSEKRGLNSDLLAKGESYSFTFTEAGKYTYFCRPHPYMTGTVEVIE